MTYDELYEEGRQTFRRMIKAGASYECAVAVRQRIETQHKVCKMCGENKALVEFYRDSYRVDGFRSECRECTRRKGWTHLAGTFNA